MPKVKTASEKADRTPNVLAIRQATGYTPDDMRRVFGHTASWANSYIKFESGHVPPPAMFRIAVSSVMRYLMEYYTEHQTFPAPEEVFNVLSEEPAEFAEFAATVGGAAPVSQPVAPAAQIDIEDVIASAAPAAPTTAAYAPVLDAEFTEVVEPPMPQVSVAPLPELAPEPPAPPSPPTPPTPVAPPPPPPPPTPLEMFKATVGNQEHLAIFLGTPGMIEWCNLETTTAAMISAHYRNCGFE